jgi:flagellar export protein FliJ
MFRFSLQQVLEYRQELQRGCERVFFMARERMEQAIGERQALETERRAVAKKQAELAAGGPTLGVAVFSPGNYMIHQEYLDELSERIERKTLEVEQLRAEAEKKRAVLIEAMRDVEIMAALKKEELKDYEYAERKNEEKALSDLAIFNFNQRRREKIASK